MGAQQILMLVIGVIVVGLAVAVGIVMFNSNAYNANRTAIAADMQGLKIRMSEFWMLPSSMGGANQNTANLQMENVGNSLGLSNNDGVYSYSGDNGEFRLISVDNGEVVIGGLGNVAKHNDLFPYIKMTVDMMTQSAELEIKDAAGFE
ncbi:MAG: hypothetical protein PHH43_07460 [Candidatus Cloacimonetes bacterium]|nr:hypothetical protein [Candidatus Cloacimonadota bacterium]